MPARFTKCVEFLFVITSLTFETNFTEINANRFNSDIVNQPCEEIEPVPLCPNEHSILLGGECTSCTNHKKKRKDISFCSELMEGYDCPIPGENFQKRKLTIGARFLNGNNLKVVTIHRLPFSHVDGKTFTGVVFEFLSALEVKYNFSTMIFLPYDGNWGSLEKNGTWNGMIGQILRKEADIGAAPFTITLERAQAVDFSTAYHDEPTAILIPAPEEEEKLSVVIRPLSHEVWFALFVTICILIPTFYILHYFSLSIRKDLKLKRKSFLSIVSESLMFITGSLVQESVISPVNKTTRFLIAIWWMVTLILANIYMAILVSYLSVPKLHNFVDSLEDLAHQTQLKWTFRQGTAHQSLFKSTSSTGLFKSIGDHVSLDELVVTDKDGVEKVLTSHTAFLKEKSFLDVALAEDFKCSKKCRLTLAKRDFFTVGLAFAVQKKAPYLSLLNFEISNAHATGLLVKWKQKHWPSDLWCTDAASFIISTQPPTRKLTLNDLQGTFLILGVGLTSAFIGFLLEQLYFRRKAIRLISSSISNKPLITLMR